MTSGGKKYQAYEIRVLDPFSFCNSGFKDFKAAKSVVFFEKILSYDNNSKNLLSR